MIFSYHFLPISMLEEPIYLEISQLPLPSMVTFHSNRLFSYSDYPNIANRDLHSINVSVLQ